MVQSTRAWDKTSKTTRFLTYLGFFAILFLNIQAKGNTPKTTRTKNYTVPVYFDALGAEHPMPPVQLEYDLESQKGMSLQIGSVTINEKTLGFGIRNLADIDSRFSQKSSGPYFIANWPAYLFPEAKIELLTRDGEVIWSREIKTADFKPWRDLVKSSVKTNKDSPLAEIEWGVPSQELNIPFEGLADGFRFCLAGLRERQGESFERLCSQRYVVRKMASQVLLGRLRDVARPRVIVNGDPAPLKNILDVPSDVPTRFFAELATGETLEFSSRPLDVKWADFALVTGTKYARVVGYDTPPIGPHYILNPDKFPEWVKKFRFEPTIFDPRKFWSYGVEATDARVYFPGTQGGVFRHNLPVEQAPSSHLRLHLAKNTPKGTYRDGVKLHGRKQPTSQVSSEQYRIIDTGSTTLFDWSFQAPEKGRLNRSSLLIQDGDKSYKAYHELYRGFANELSARLSTVLSDQGLILMGEVAYSHWFEDFLGWDHYYITKQRWGVSAKQFQSFTKFRTGDLGDTTLANTNVDLKYRFTPGLWGRDETHGAILSYQIVNVDVQLTKFTAPMAGVGWFWARSMPRVFDEMFNLVPFMNYPKWVDMEFIFYGGSMDSNITLNTNFALNFHGQVMWKDNFFGEAGFGIKRYAFVDKANSYQANLGYTINTLYGILGIGFKF